MRNFWCPSLPSKYALFFQQKWPVSNNFTKFLVPKTLIIFPSLSSDFFRKIIAHNLKSNKDILIIPTESDSAGQQLKDREKKQ